MTALMLGSLIGTLISAVWYGLVAKS
jgi:hypothetical protein